LRILNFYLLFLTKESLKTPAFPIFNSDCRQFRKSRPQPSNFFSFRCALTESGRTNLSTHQITPAHVEICQGKQDIELVVILGYAPVSGFGKPKLPLDDPEWVLHFGSNTGFGLLQQFLWTLFIELFSLAQHHCDIPVDLAILMFGTLLYPSVA